MFGQLPRVGGNCLKKKHKIKIVQIFFLGVCMPPLGKDRKFCSIFESALGKKAIVDILGRIKSRIRCFVRAARKKMRVRGIVVAL